MTKNENIINKVLHMMTCLYTKMQRTTKYRSIIGPKRREKHERRVIYLLFEIGAKQQRKCGGNLFLTTSYLAWHRI